MVRVDKAGHDDPAGSIDHLGTPCSQVCSDCEDLLALDQHVGLGEVAYLRVHRHDRATANDIAVTSLTAVPRWVICRGGARREQSKTSRGEPGRRCGAF